MRHKILVVEDDKSFRDALYNMLSQEFIILTAENGNAAKTILSKENIELVISDIQMPFFNGVDLLEWIKKNKPTPVILMTGFSHILETQRAHELGVDEFLAKPFKSHDLLGKIKKVFGIVESQEKPAPKTLPEFFKVPIEDFVSHKETTCPVFIKLNDDKFIKIAHTGGKIPETKINLFKEKGINFLYIKKEDFSELLGFSIKLTKAMAANSQIDPVKKSRFINYTGELLSQQIFSKDFDQTSCQYAKEFLNTSIDMISNDNQCGDLLIGLNEHTDFLYSHSLGVSSISVLIAKKLGWESPSVLFKLAFAGLFHDIGKKELPKALLEKPRFQLTVEERKQYEGHTIRGKEILEGLKNAPSEAAFVAYEHHENSLGNGYPRSVDFVKIHPFSKIINVADIFCNYAVKNANDHKVLSSTESIAKMQSNKSFEMDKPAFMALCALIKKPA